MFFLLGDLTLVDEPKAKKLKRDYDMDHLQLFEEANKVLKGLNPDIYHHYSIMSKILYHM